MPFVTQVDVSLPPRTGAQAEEVWLALRTPKGRHDLVVDVRSEPLSRSAAMGLVARASRPPARSWVAFSPYVSPPVGQLLASHHIDFVDQAGNIAGLIGTITDVTDYKETERALEASEARFRVFRGPELRTGRLRRSSSSSCTGHSGSGGTR